MWNDEIVEETRRVREQHAAQFNYDLAAIYQDLKAKEQESGREVVRLEPKLPLDEVVRSEKIAAVEVEFTQAADYVLAKNAELYKRLA